MYAVIFIAFIIISFLYLLYRFKGQWRFIILTIISFALIAFGFLGLLNAGIKADENIPLSIYDNYIPLALLVFGIILLIFLFFFTLKYTDH